MGPHSSFEKVMSSNRKLAYNSKSRNQSRKQWNSTNTVQLCELFHFSTTSPQCFNTRKEKEGISLPTFISQTQKMFILHCVYQVLLTESNRKLWDIPAMSSENRKAVSTDQETSVLFSTLKKKKKSIDLVCIVMSASCLRAHCHDTFWYLLGNPQERPSNETPLLL